MQFESVPAILIGGCLFLAVVLFAGHFTPGYSHARQSISELGMPGAVYGLLVRWVGFVPLGLSFILFAFQSGSLFSNHVPFVLFLVTGLSILFAGIFPTDPDNRRDTPSGKIHASAVIMLLLLLSASPFTFSIASLYRNPPPEWFLVFSFVMGIPVSIVLALSSHGISWRWTALFQRTAQPSLPGLQQRLLLALHYVWWSVFSRVLAAEYLLFSSGI